MRKFDEDLDLEMWVSNIKTPGGWEWCVIKWGAGGVKDWEVEGQEADFIGASHTAELEFWRRQIELTDDI